MISSKESSGFMDGSGNIVNSLDTVVVEHPFGSRTGILIQAIEDGDALVVFTDTNKMETVKWKNLRKIPAKSCSSANSQGTKGFKPTHVHKNGNSYMIIHDKAVLQASTKPLDDETQVVVYVNEKGDVWVRSREEFEDGRFIELKNPSL